MQKPTNKSYLPGYYSELLLPHALGLADVVRLLLVVSGNQVEERVALGSTMVHGQRRVSVQDGVHLLGYDALWKGKWQQK